MKASDLKAGNLYSIPRDTFMQSGILEAMGYQEKNTWHKPVLDSKNYGEKIVLEPARDIPANVDSAAFRLVEGAAIQLRYLVIKKQQDLPFEEVPEFRPLSQIVGTVQSGRSQSGWDPEMFVLHGDGSLFPAFEFLPPKEKALKPTTYSSPSFWDGFQAEFNTYPASCHQVGFSLLHRGLYDIREKARLKDKDARLTLQNVFELPPAVLFSAPKECVSLGCQPSMNAYGTPQFSVDDPTQFPYRMAGGHIHFQTSDRSPEMQARMAKCMDFLLTIPTVGMFAEIDDPRRRQFYGRAGEYRPTSYGLEYRTLSNAWLGCPQVGHILMELARLAAGLAFTNFSIEQAKLTDDDVRSIIDSCDVSGARAVFTKHRALWSSVLGSFGHFDAFSTMVNKGVESIYPTFRNVESNWELTNGAGIQSFHGSWHEWRAFSPRLYERLAAGTQPVDL
jgi:hypothetical protein